MERSQQRANFLLLRVFVLEPELMQMQQAKCTSSPALKNVLSSLELFKEEIERFNEPTSWRKFTHFAKSKEWEERFKMLSCRLDSCLADMNVASILNNELARQRDFKESKDALQYMCTMVIEEVKKSTKSVASDTGEGQQELKRMLDEVKEVAANGNETILRMMKDLNEMKERALSPILSAEEKESLLLMSEEVNAHSDECYESICNTLKEMRSEINSEFSVLKDLVKARDVDGEKARMRASMLSRIKIHSSEVEVNKGCELGIGGFAHVYQAEYQRSVVAIKIFKPKPGCPKFDVGDIKMIENEALVTNYHGQSSAHIIRCFGLTYLSDIEIGIVLENASYGSLETLLLKEEFSESKTSISLFLLFGWFSDIASAVEHLHSKACIHKDIKAGNILITNSQMSQPYPFNAKLCDFGISRTLPDSCLGQGSGCSKRIRDSIGK